ALEGWRGDETEVLALGRGAQQNEPGIGKFDGHGMHPSRLRLGPSQSRPLTDASPGSARSPGLRVVGALSGAVERPYTCSASNRMPVLSSLSGHEVNDIASSGRATRLRSAKSHT